MSKNSEDEKKYCSGKESPRGNDAKQTQIKIEMDDKIAHDNINMNTTTRCCLLVSFLIS